MNPNQKNRPQSATQAAAGTPRPKSARRRSRELALQGLYEWLISRADVGVVMAHMREQDEHGRCDSAHLDALLQGCISQVAELDGVIAPHLDRGVAQLSPVEHAVRGLLHLCTPAGDELHGQDVSMRDESFRRRIGLG